MQGKKKLCNYFLRLSVLCEECIKWTWLPSNYINSSILGCSFKRILIGKKTLSCPSSVLMSSFTSDHSFQNQPSHFSGSIVCFHIIQVNIYSSLDVRTKPRGAMRLWHTCGSWVSSTRRQETKMVMSCFFSSNMLFVIPIIFSALTSMPASSRVSRSAHAKKLSPSSK